jgi:hypothetical protein
MLYHTEPLVLSFEIPITVVIERLGVKVSKASLFQFAPKGMLGNVSEANFKIWRGDIPKIKNTLNPIFIGSFGSDGNKTILSGLLRINRFNRVHFTYSFYFLMLFVAIAIVAVITEPSKGWFLLFIGIFMFAFEFIFVKKEFSRWENEKEWLIKNISMAINNDNLRSSG